MGLATCGKHVGARGFCFVFVRDVCLLASRSTSASLASGGPQKRPGKHSRKTGAFVCIWEARIGSEEAWHGQNKWGCGFR